MDLKNNWKFSGSTRFVLLSLCFFVNFASIESYVAKGSVFTEKELLIIQQYPNYQNEKIVDFRPIRWRIDPKSIANFNQTTTMLSFKFWVDEETPDRFPVFISFIHRQDNIQVQLPYTFRSKEGTRTRYTYASRTICLGDLNKEQDSILVTAQSGSSQLINFHMNVTIDDVGIRLDQHRKFSMTPMTPTFVKFPFNDTLSENVVLRTSANNENCIAIAIQEPKCPVFSVEENFRGGNNGWELITKKSAIRVNMREKKYLNGFFVKVILLQDDTLCGKIFSTSSALRRQTNIDIVLQNDLPPSFTNGHFLWNMAIPPVVSLLVGIIIGSIYLITYACSKRRMLACRTYNVNRADNNSVCVENFFQPRNVQSNNYGRWTIFTFVLYAIPILLHALDNGLDSNSASGLYGKCSYNSMCSHNFWIFKDFNHLWSNISYLILGICFIFISLMKKYMQKKSEEGEGIQYFVGLYYAMGLGLIAKGIMSFAYHFCPSKSNSENDIIYLAILIAICQLKISEFRRPNTFTMEFSCGALTVILLTAALGTTFERYLFAHEEIFLGFRIVVAVIQGIFIFYASIYAIYIGYPVSRVTPQLERDEVPLQTLPFTTILSPEGSNNAQPSLPQEAEVMKSFGDIPRFMWIFPKIWHWKLPKFRFERFFYVIMLLSLNGYIIYFSLTVNYCLYVFAFLGANFGLNLTYYVVMKVVLGEFACSWKSLQVFPYLILALGVGTVAGYFFLENMTEWSDPSSHFRSVDESCTWLTEFPFFDSHDSYHVVSAHAFFLIFMVLLSIDDGVEGVNREYLLVF